MTPEDINRAIAERVGARLFTEDGGAFWHFVTSDGRQFGPPTEDLNAMHEAEKVAFNGNGDLWAKYLDEELPSIAFPAPPECAPAPARAEAFLRTIGKWRDA